MLPNEYGIELIALVCTTHNKIDSAWCVCLCFSAFRMYYNIDCSVCVLSVSRGG